MSVRIHPQGKNMIRILTRSILTLLIISLPAIVTVSAQEVTYEKYTLANGMTVILHEDHSVPSAAINLWYNVGSKDEQPGRSGFAHMFEHLMFMGTKRVPGGNFDTIMEAGGGFNNATTSADRTNYFSMGPAELLPTLLWLDADRLEALDDEMNQEKLDKQRAVVRNERRQSYENRPYGMARLRTYELMFPEGHPYHLPVIGTHEDLEAATVDDVKNFFRKYYVPSNTSLVVAGDFDPEKIKPQVEKMFGALPRGSDVVHAKPEPVQLKGVTRLTMTDNVQFGRSTFVYHSPSQFQPGDAEMDLVAGVLSDGISSRLYQRLITDNPLALDVSAYQESNMLGSLFQVQATARGGVSLDDLEKAIDEVIQQFLTEGPTVSELEKQKAQLEFAAVSQLQSLLRKADRLNMYDFHFGEPDGFERDLNRYRNATVASVKEWAGKVLTRDKRLELRVIPELKTPETSPLDEQPGIDTAAAFTPPLPTTFELKNGVTVHHWERHELPMVAMTMVLPRGTATDPADQAGLTSLAVNMLDEGAAGKSAVEFSDALNLLGANFSGSARRESTRVSLSSLTRNFDDALDLYADAVIQPEFDVSEWERVHTLHVQGLIQAQDRPGTVATNVSMRTYFGDAHPYSRPSGGTPDTAGAVSVAAAREQYERLFRPEGAVILSAGDLTARELEKKLGAALGNWRAVPKSKPLAKPDYPDAAGGDFHVVLVDRPGAVQTIVNFTLPAPLHADPKRQQYELFGTILGGSFTSRLNQNLREDKGYTYGARCNYSMGPNVGYFTASSRVRADVTGASIGEFLGEFNGIRSGDISAREAEKARSTGRVRMVQSFAGLNGILGAAAALIENNQPFSDLGEELARIAAVTEKDLNGIASGAVPLETGVLVLVGDKENVLSQLEGLALPQPVEFTAAGEKVQDR
jgi:predicted Zn-dependent peptidase